MIWKTVMIYRIFANPQDEMLTEWVALKSPPLSVPFEHDPNFVSALDPAAYDPNFVSVLDPAPAYESHLDYSPKDDKEYKEHE